ncbi:Integrator complex subunit 9 [Linnemannia schmuckeri]|uniref:Integrator complex subunit 9 n=1 Tax=Linnemannia schmuckeri TaxID=64567 RepID=A0A9P5V734_9FUNG|nr:Integrator complex subunit 9 [Linnemannia schmuckeri]
MRLTSLLPDGEPNCLVLKVRQMLIMLDCGLGQEQLYAMPVREGGLTEDHKDNNSNTTTTGSTADNSTAGSKRKFAETDIRQDWASFLKASSIQFPTKKMARGSNSQPSHSSKITSSTTGTTSSGSTSTADGTIPIAHNNIPSKFMSTREYMFKLPDFSGVDLKAIDVVLISNYNHILALPYLTEYTDFQGRIFATEPTIEFGRQLMIEFVTFFGTSVTSSPHEIIDRKELMARAGAGLYPAYTHADIKACIDKIQPVRFREHISLFGSLKLTAHSAGYCLGSSNWLIQIGTENIAYVSSSSTQGNLHPDLFDGTLMENASTVVATDLCPRGSFTYNTGVNLVCQSIASTIARKGNVLIPCTISGFLFDLLEDVHLHLNRMGLIGQVQYSFISPVADTALQYSNILAEWMAPRKQEMVYIPEAPLLHGILLEKEKGIAKHYKSVHGAFSSDLKLPCIVFGGHPSLRSGPMVNLLHMWGNKPTNTIVFIEPRMDVVAAMEPYENLAIAQQAVQLDIRLSIDQLVEVMNKYRHPRHILVPMRAIASTLADGTVELADAKRTTSTSSTRWSAYKVGESVQLGMGSLYESVLLSEELAKGILPQAFGNVSFAPIAGSLSIYNNQMQLKPASVQGRQLLSLYTQRLLLGVMNLPHLLAGLTAIGVTNIEVSESEGKEEKETGVPEIKIDFELQGQTATIILREKETIVKCDENIRSLLREPILKCFQSF